MSPVKRTPIAEASGKFSPDQLKELACLIVSLLPAKPDEPLKSPLGQFLAGYGSLILVIVLAIGGYIFYFGSQGQKISNFDATLNSMRSQMVTNDLLNSRFAEMNTKQDAINNNLVDLANRVSRLEGKAMNGK